MFVHIFIFHAGDVHIIYTPFEQLLHFSKFGFDSSSIKKKKWHKELSMRTLSCLKKYLIHGLYMQLSASDQLRF